MSGLKLGNDFEFYTDSMNIPNRFCNDYSVPVELDCVPEVEYIAEVSRIREELQILQNSIGGEEVFSGSTGCGYQNSGLGGHIHFEGLFNPSNRLRNAMDLLLAVPIAAIADSEFFQARVKPDSSYGRLCQSAGYHRMREDKGYGFEYRTLPSLPSLPVALGVFALAKLIQTHTAVVEELVGDIKWNRQSYYHHKVSTLRKLALKVLRLIWSLLSTDQKSHVGFLKNMISLKKTWLEERPCRIGWKLTTSFVLSGNKGDDFIEEILYRLPEVIEIYNLEPLNINVYLFGRHDREGHNQDMVSSKMGAELRIGLSHSFRRLLVSGGPGAAEPYKKLLSFIRKME